MKISGDKLLDQLYLVHVGKPEDQMKLDKMVLEELEILRALRVVQQRMDAIHRAHGIYGSTDKTTPLARSDIDEEITA